MSKTPHRLNETAYVDPTSAVRGSHLLDVSREALIHPRSTISTDAGAIFIGEGTLISEHCQIGNTVGSGQARPSAHPQSNNVNILKHESNAGIDDVAQHVLSTTTSTPSSVDIEGSDIIKIASRVHIAPSVTIQAPCTVGDGVQIESNVVISPNCIIHAHSKICAGITLAPATEVPAWTIVYGSNGTARRRRKNDENGQRQERQRLKGLDVLRDGDVEILKRAAAAKAPLVKTESAARTRVK